MFDTVAATMAMLIASMETLFALVMVGVIFFISILLPLMVYVIIPALIIWSLWEVIKYLRREN